MKRRAVKMARKRRIDVNDIIGQVFNGMKVNKYVGDKERVVCRNGIIQIQKMLYTNANVLFVVE